MRFALPSGGGAKAAPQPPGQELQHLHFVVAIVYFGKEIGGVAVDMAEAPHLIVAKVEGGDARYFVDHPLAHLWGIETHGGGELRLAQAQEHKRPVIQLAFGAVRVPRRSQALQVLLQAFILGGHEVGILAPPPRGQVGRKLRRGLPALIQTLCGGPLGSGLGTLPIRQ